MSKLRTSMFKTEPFKVPMLFPYKFLRYPKVQWDLLSFKYGVFLKFLRLQLCFELAASIKLGQLKV